MRYRDLIDDDEFVRERDRLKQDLLKLKVLLSQTENRAATWSDLTERTFDFACHARSKFLKRQYSDQKRDIHCTRSELFFKG
jgi:hypothetical protein